MNRWSDTVLTSDVAERFLNGKRRRRPQPVALSAYERSEAYPFGPKLTGHVHLRISCPLARLCCAGEVQCRFSPDRFSAAAR